MTDEISQKHIEGLWRHLVPLTNHEIEEGRIDKTRLHYGVRRLESVRLTKPESEGGGGLSQRQAAEVLGVDHKTIQNDLGLARKSPESGEKVANLTQADEAEQTRISEIQAFNRELNAAKSYVKSFYLAARSISRSDDQPEDVVRTMRSHRYLLKQNVTPSDLRKAGEFLIQLSMEETK